MEFGSGVYVRAFLICANVIEYPGRWATHDALNVMNAIGVDIRQANRPVPFRVFLVLEQTAGRELTFRFEWVDPAGATVDLEPLVRRSGAGTTTIDFELRLPVPRGGQYSLKLFIDGLLSGIAPLNVNLGYRDHPRQGGADLDPSIAH